MSTVMTVGADHLRVRVAADGSKDRSEGLPRRRKEARRGADPAPRLASPSRRHAERQPPRWARERAQLRVVDVAEAGAARSSAAVEAIRHVALDLDHFRPPSRSSTARRDRRSRDPPSFIFYPDFAASGSRRRAARQSPPMESSSSSPSGAAETGRPQQRPRGATPGTGRSAIRTSRAPWP